MVNKNSKEYKQGFIDGYKKARRDSKKIRKQGNKEFKSLKDAINKLKKVQGK